MSLARRIVVCLDVDAGRVVKGTQFASLRDVGDPADMAERYEAAGADEIVFLDISATTEGRAMSLEAVRETAERLFIPLTVGGGIRSVDDARRALRAGADKVAVNSAALATPHLLRALADRFGRQCVVASIDAKRFAGRWAAYSHGGRQPTRRDAVAWATECAALGAGELVLTSIDRDGARCGYDLALTADVRRAVTIPVIASGGAGSPRDVVEVLRDAEADAALVAGILHDGQTTISEIKHSVASAGITIRQPT